MKRLERGYFTVKDFIKNHRTKEHVAMLEKTLEVYKREDAKYLNKHLVGYIEFLLNEKKPTASGYADFTEEQIVNLYYNGDFREHISYIYSVFATELEFNKKYGYSNPSDEVIDFWKNTYKYFENFAKEQNDKQFELHFAKKLFDKQPWKSDSYLGLSLELAELFSNSKDKKLAEYSMRIYSDCVGRIKDFDLRYTLLQKATKTSKTYKIDFDSSLNSAKADVDKIIAERKAAAEKRKAELEAKKTKAKTNK